MYNISKLWFHIIVVSLFYTFSGQAAGQSFELGNVGSHSSTSHEPSNLIDQRTEFFNSEEDEEESRVDAQSTTSLTVGYAATDFNLQTDQGSNKYRYNGELSTLMLSSTSSHFMVGYGTAPARENAGDIRNITVDLQTGGNIVLFNDLLKLPIKAYIPVRVNLGYQNLALLEEQGEEENANIGTGGLGAGLGGQVRIPTGLPWLEDNLTGIVSLVRSTGGLSDLSNSTDQNSIGGQQDDPIIEGIRLTQSTDLNIEGKFERLMDSDIGVTVGLTFRWIKWTDEAADNFGQVFDVVMGEQEGLDLRSTQSLFRVGINW